MNTEAIIRKRLVYERLKNIKYSTFKYENSREPAYITYLIIEINCLRRILVPNVNIN